MNTRSVSIPHTLAISGITLITYIAFGSTARYLGHTGDSWAYMADIRQSGPYGILSAQPGRIVLPIPWAVGYLVAGADPWIYHVLAALFIAASGICLYFLVLVAARGAFVFAFCVAALSILWPADPTRYDIATLGNRQALLLLLVGWLAYGRALRHRRAWLLIVGFACVSLSLLTYEGQLLLVLAALAALLACIARHGGLQRRLQLVAALVGPALVWSVVTAAVTATAADHRTYETDLVPALSPIRVMTQLGDGLAVAFADSVQVPARLIARHAAPRLERAGASTAITFAVMLALLPFGCALPSRRVTLQLGLIGLMSTLLALMVFAVTDIPMNQPGRTQTFSLMGVALVVCAGFAYVCDLLGSIRLVGRYVAAVLFSFGCICLVFLFFVMANVYERNYTQLWSDQSRVLRSLTNQAPDIRNGSLVVITGLPDTRIIFVGGYTCEFALAYLDGHQVYPQKSRLDASTVKSAAIRRINCALIFNGRNLDPQNTIDFTPDGIVDNFRGGFDYLFPYSKVVLFTYNPDGTVTLQNELPASLLTDGVDANAYNPKSLISPRTGTANSTSILNADESGDNQRTSG